MNRIWCHVCNIETTSTISSSEEVECNNCHGTFVEALGQGIEQFLNPSSSAVSIPSQPLEIPIGLGDRSSQGSPRIIHSADELINSSTIENIRNPNQSIQMNLPLQSSLGQRPMSAEPSDRMISGLERTIRELGLRDEGGRGMRMQINRGGGLFVREGQRGMGLGRLLGLALGGGFAGGVGGGAGSMEGLDVPDDQFDRLLHQLFMQSTGGSGASPASEGDIQSLRRVVVSEKHLRAKSILEEEVEVEQEVEEEEDEVVEEEEEEEEEEIRDDWKEEEEVVFEDIEGWLAGSECLISFEPFEVGEVVMVLPTCGHTFKEEAGEKWLRMHGSCPVCRVQISSSSSSSSSSSYSSPASSPRKKEIGKLKQEKRKKNKKKRSMKEKFEEGTNEERGEKEQVEGEGEVEDVKGEKFEEETLQETRRMDSEIVIARINDGRDRVEVERVESIP